MNYLCTCDRDIRHKNSVHGMMVSLPEANAEAKAAAEDANATCISTSLEPPQSLTAFPLSWNMGSHRQLPLELVDEILDNVQDDKLTLASFSTVCKQWSPSARRRLFRVLKLCAGAVPDMPHAKYPTLDVPDWKRWAREFAATPTLPSYVHELHVFGDNPVCEPEFLMEVCTYQDEDGKSIAEGTNFEVVGTDALFAMAQVLPNLKRVILHSIMVKCAALPSHDPIPLEYLRLDMVYSLDGENILELFEVFAPNEVHADVYARSGEDVTEPLKPLSEPPPRGLIGTKWYIRSDEDSTALFRDLLRTSFVRHIQSLDVALTGDDDELIAFISLFQVIAPRLKQLVLDLFEALIWAIDFTTFIR